MTAPAITRAGKLAIKTTTRPETGRQYVTAAVLATDLLREILGELADRFADAPEPVVSALLEINRCRAEEVNAAGFPSQERLWAEKGQAAMDELLSVVDVAPDPSIPLTVEEGFALADAVHAALHAGAPAFVTDGRCPLTVPPEPLPPLVPIPAEEPWTHESVGHPLGEDVAA
jgi:hypothetical protein